MASASKGRFVGFIGGSVVPVDAGPMARVRGGMPSLSLAWPKAGAKRRPGTTRSLAAAGVGRPRDRKAVLAHVHHGMTLGLRLDLGDRQGHVALDVDEKRPFALCRPGEHALDLCCRRGCQRVQPPLRCASPLLSGLEALLQARLVVHSRTSLQSWPGYHESNGVAFVGGVYDQLKALGPPDGGARFD